MLNEINSQETEGLFEDASAALFGTEGILDIPTEPEKDGKANVVLADQIFNSGLVMAEWVELGRVHFAGKHILELGASTSLPSLLASTFEHPPASMLTTDYPDEAIIANLKRNIKRNEEVLRCPISCQGYKWGEDVSPLLSTLPPSQTHFEILILSDLLWLHSEHLSLLCTISHTLSPHGLVYITAGHYSKRWIVDSFFEQAGKMGFEREEVEVVPRWEGKMNVWVGEGREGELAVRKAAVWGFRMWWRGRDVR